MSLDVQSQPLEDYRGNDTVFSAKCVRVLGDDVDPTSWSIKAVISQTVGGVVSYETTSVTVTLDISDNKYVIQFTVPAATTWTLTRSNYAWEIVRINSGQCRRLAGGTIRWREPVRADNDP